MIMPNIPHNPDWARIEPVHNSPHHYDAHGPDRFRYSPPARRSFRDDHRGDWRRGPDYRHNVGSPGNWGRDNRTHLGNDQHHGNNGHNNWSWQTPRPNGHGGNRGHEGHGNAVHRQPEHHVDYRPNHYGGRSYSYGPSRTRHSR